MKTCVAGAAFTERSKRGSKGVPATLGISMRKGGSSASSTACGRDSGLRSAMALSSSPVICGSTEVGAGGAAQAARRKIATIDDGLVLNVMSLPFAANAGALTASRKKRQRFFASRAANDDFALGNAHDTSLAEGGTFGVLLAVDDRDTAIGSDQHRFQSRSAESGRARARPSGVDLERWTERIG